MKKQTVITQKKRGPSPTGKGTLLGVRLQPDALAALDGWISKQAENMSRPEAIRRLVEQGLAAQPKAKKAAAKKAKPTRERKK